MEEFLWEQHKEQSEKKRVRIKKKYLKSREKKVETKMQNNVICM